MSSAPVKKHTAVEYLSMLQHLLPRGLAWTRRQGAALTHTLHASAEELARIDAVVHLLISEANPQSAINALEDWERVLGLPDACLPSGSSLQERRTAVITKLNDAGRQDLAYWYELAAILGFDVDIIERAPFTSGLSRCGSDDRLGPAEQRFWWTVRVYGKRVVWFRAGASSCGDSLGSINYASELECIMRRDKLAHTLLTFDYQEQGR